MKDKQKDRLFPPLMRLVRANNRMYPWLFVMLTATALDGAGQVVMGWAFSLLVDNTISKDLAGLARGTLSVACILGASILFSALSRYSSGRYANFCIKSLRDTLGKKLTQVKLSWLEKRRTGDMLSILGNDIGQISAFFEEHMRWFIGDWIRFALSLTYLIILNPYLTLATVAYIPIGAVITMLAGKPVQKLAEKQNRALGEANAIAQDSVSGHAEVKTFNMHNWLSDRYATSLQAWLKAGLKGAGAQAVVDSISLVNLIVPFMLLSCLGLWFVTQGRMTGGELLAFIFVSNGIVNPLMSLTWRTSELRKAAGASVRLTEVLDAPIERQDGSDHTLDASKPLISFRNIHFSYERTDGEGDTTQQVVFSGLNLDIARGETVAVVGQSGSGKSTLLKLAAGLYEPDDGQVFFGGQELEKWHLHALREHMAMVDQDTYLFPGSIAENVACAVYDKGGEEASNVAEAVEMARLHEYVDTLPEGLESSVGERGSRLSGGQRQRVAIARAALRNAAVMLMDEPTSALDTTTEKEIQRELMALTAGRTALIVTHKLSMALVADRIVVLDGGAAVEQGTHLELMEAKGLYYTLYSQQVEPEGNEVA